METPSDAFTKTNSSRQLRAAFEMSRCHKEWSDHAPSQYTYFIVSPTRFDRQPYQIENSETAVHFPKCVELFHESMYPLCVVSVILLNAGLRPPFPNDNLELYEPWGMTAWPTGTRTEAGDWSDYNISHPLWINGEYRDNKCAPTMFHNFVEDLTCGYRKIVISKRVLGATNHSFLTTGSSTNYFAVPCLLRLSIVNWLQIPRTVQQYEWFFDPLPKNAMPEYQPTAFDEYLKKVGSVPRSMHKARFFDAARTLGPHSGSFISCSLWDGLNRIEAECILEIMAEDEAEGIWRGVLHVLSESDLVSVEPGMQLRIWDEIYDRRANVCRDTIIELGDILPIDRPV